MNDYYDKETLDRVEEILPTMIKAFIENNARLDVCSFIFNSIYKELDYARDELDKQK